MNTDSKSGYPVTRRLTVLIAALLATSASAERVRFEISQPTTFGTSVFVLGDHPLLGGGSVVDALKLSPESYPVWFVEVDLPPGTTVAYRYLLREDAAARLGDPTNATFISASPLTATTGGEAPARRGGAMRYFSGVANPVLEIRDGAAYRRIPFSREADGRGPGESLWRAALDGLPPVGGDWEFRIDLGNGSYDVAPYGPHYITTLASPWLQDGDLFDYRPAPLVSAPRVVKQSGFAGSLPTRALYIYLPRGYDEHAGRDYPVLYMHDGQNCFQAFVGDSGFGASWRADETATLLIRQGRLPEIVIVGVSHGGSERIPEYLPPYGDGLFQSRAAATAAYYINEVAPHIAANYRIRPGRDNAATMGSSMGGFFSTYLAWDFAAFARSHAALSPAYWTGGTTGDLVYTHLGEDTPRDVRFYLDSGTAGTSGDGTVDTLRARDALIGNGYAIGPDFLHLVSHGDAHNEGAWAGRLAPILQFLFPVQDSAEETWLLH